MVRERREITFGVLFNARSIGIVTCCSTSSAANPGVLGDHDHARIRDVRIRFELELAEGPSAGQRQSDGADHNE